MRKFFIAALFISLLSCNDSTESGSGSSSAGNNDAGLNSGSASIISSSIVKTFPHDTSSFTQGLAISNGQLYEGTGEYGHSKLLRTDLNTGKILQSAKLDSIYFGEGITIFHDTIYQLTWKEKKVFLYSLRDFKKIKEFDLTTEGWGITNNGQELIVSDGSSNLYYYSPANFQLLRTQSITEAGSLSYNLNELEYIDGFIYANQWQAPYIFKIDPGAGTVLGKIDLTTTYKRIKAIDPDADVPNGIAYDPASKKIFVTGKKWPELYELQLGH